MGGKLHLREVRERGFGNWGVKKAKRKDKGERENGGEERRRRVAIVGRASMQMVGGSRRTGQGPGRKKGMGV